ncbi:MAG: aminotransferase class V-fold PLP-dependent enzyme [Actinobacteria bacterium]|uniref:cysteine desulfurase n=1 Tax=freshwater metagenome TaxID=449393 RepID=A0A6J6AG79_9ZZZZ|nr:aminotransferase class V-fold PLP-dependent enzyme [Actinomycetota bacterium]
MTEITDSPRRYVYLDHAATSPLRSEARDAMAKYGDVMYANPSGSHRFAREARQVIDEARDVVAEVIGCRPGEVIFTSGGTEGDNAAVLGATRRTGGTAVCGASEHHAVLHCVEHVGGTVVPVTSAGSVDPDVMRAVLTDLDNVAVVSVMAVNNETGAISDIEHISHAVRRQAPNAVFHTDAVQAACWQDLRTVWPHVDALTLSAHKFGGPKGMGILVLREGSILEPLILGGGQERDRRSGTHNVAGIVGTSVALAVTDAHRAGEVARLGALRDQLINEITSRIECATATLAPGTGVAGTAHVCLENLESESLLYLLDEANVCVSAASACASGAMEPSHVLAAMGVSRERIKGSLRFSLGHTTTASDIAVAIEATVAAAARLGAVTS